MLYTPGLNELLQPPFAAIPLQVLAYQETVPRAWEVDKPWNLPKAATVK